MEMLQFKGNNHTQMLRLYGDKTKNTEPASVRIHFPCGSIELSRLDNGEYWVHLCLEDDSDDYGSKEIKSTVSDARIDLKHKHAGQEDIGDLNNPDMYHFAIKCKPI